MARTIEIMDTTLRDGEQTPGVSFTATEKLTLAKLLLTELKVDRIEIASARVSAGEFAAVKSIAEWAASNNCLEKIEVLTFLDKGASLDWMVEAGTGVQNLLTKGSLNHLTHQLRKTPEQHFSAVAEIIALAQDKGIETNVYLEDWSNGMRNSREYVFDYLDFLVSQPVKRILLPDTLGVLCPADTFQYLLEIVERYPETHFDFHGHNDYGLSVANVMEALRAGCHGIHLTVNGMGERAGNAPLASCIAVIKDFMPEINTNVDERNLYDSSKTVSSFSGFTIPVNKPVVGANVFTQTAGIHADGDNKHNLYFNDLLPERFDRKRKYALGKTSGKSNITKNLDELGLTLTNEEVKKVTARIVELGDQKKVVTTQDLPYIISDVLQSHTFEKKVVVKSYVLMQAMGLKPSSTMSIEINGELFEESSQGIGKFDAFMNALHQIYKSRNVRLPKLVNYQARIAPGTRTYAVAETQITWKNGTEEFMTRGLDTDETVSAIKATEKMLNLVFPREQESTISKK